MTRPARERPLRVVVLVSGRGSNLQAIVREIEAGRLDAQVTAVISDRADAAALPWASERGIATAVLAPKSYSGRDAYGDALAKLVDSHAPDLLVMAGFMRILSDGFVNRFLGRALNIHPSLLPKYTGLHTHRRALEAGDRVHGASVHFVTPELDGGPVVLQASVPVLPGDDENRLAARVLRQEHMIYPESIGWFADGRLEMRDGAPWLDGRPLTAPIVRTQATQDSNAS
jgi:phosphoribosylglycinamide formyltransferase-1